MKSISPLKISLTIFAALALTITMPVALAQPTNEPNPQLSVAIVAGKDKAPLVTLRANETSAAAVLSLLAAKTGAKIIVKKDAPIDSLEIKRVPLAEAIAQVARGANLKLESQGAPGTGLEATYVIGEIEAHPNIKSSATAIDLDFKEISAAQLVKILAEQIGIKAQVDPDATEKLLDIAMFNTTAVEALQAIADAADLELSQMAQGYVLRERVNQQVAVKPDLGFEDVPVLSFFRTLAQQFGLQISVASNLPDKMINVDVSGMTPEEALKAAAKAADFELTKINGTYIVRERAATSKQ